MIREVKNKSKMHSPFLSDGGSHLGNYQLKRIPQDHFTKNRLTHSREVSTKKI